MYRDIQLITYIEDFVGATRLSILVRFREERQGSDRISQSEFVVVPGLKFTSDSKVHAFNHLTYYHC